MATTRDFLRITPGMLDDLKPGDRVFAAQANADNPEPFYRPMSWCEITSVHDTHVVASPIDDGRLQTEHVIHFETLLGTALRVPDHLHTPCFGILAVDTGPSFTYEQKDTAFEDFHIRTQQAIAERDISQDVLTANRNAYQYLRARYNQLVSPQDADLADRALQSALDLDTTIRLIAVRRWLDHPLDPHGAVMNCMRNAHALIDDHWASPSTDEGRIALKCVNDLRVAITIATHGPHAAKSMLPLKPIDTEKLEQLVPSAGDVICVQSHGPEQRFTSPEAAGAAFYHAPADGLASAYRRVETTLYPQYYGRTFEQGQTPEGATVFAKELSHYGSAANIGFNNGFFAAMGQSIEQRLQDAFEIDEQLLSDLEVLVQHQPELAAEIWERAAPEHLDQPDCFEHLNRKTAPAMRLS